MLGALVSGATSLIGGLFGKASADDKYKQQLRQQATVNQLNFDLINQANIQERERAYEAAKVPIVTTSSGGLTSNWVNMPAMMEAAEKYGFNPSSFLKAGGLGMFGMTSTGPSTTTVTGSTAMDAALSGARVFQHGSQPVNTAPSYGEVFGNALTAGANTWLQGYNQDQQNAFQSSMLNAQLQGINRSGTGASGQSPYGGGYLSTAGKSRSFTGVPVAQGAGSVSSPRSGAALSYKNPGDILSMGGIQWSTDPNTSSADDFETRYGDAGGSILGAGVLASDLDRWMKMNRVDTAAVQAGRDFGNMIRMKAMDLYNQWKPAGTAAGGDYGSNDTSQWSVTSW